MMGTNNRLQAITTTQRKCLILTGPALAQRQVVEYALDRSADYLMIVQENQPQLFQDVDICFQPVPLPGQVYEVASIRGSSDGYLEVWEIVTSAAVKGYIDWPGVEQVVQVTHTMIRVRTGEKMIERTYAVTSIRPEVNPLSLLDTIREVR